MSRISELSRKISALYLQHNPERADWADWLFENHVFLVSDKARELAHRFNAKEDLAEAAGMLHDIADSFMNRFDPRHEETSLEKSRELLKESGFIDKEIKIVVDDAIQFHGCHEQKPNSLEGKVMATADAVVHLTTDFYDHAKEEMLKTKTLEETKGWALPKIERDYYEKIFFDEVREEVKEGYQRSKDLFAS